MVARGQRLCMAIELHGLGTERRGASGCEVGYPAIYVRMRRGPP